MLANDPRGFAGGGPDAHASKSCPLLVHMPRCHHRRIAKGRSICPQGIPDGEGKARARARGKGRGRAHNRAGQHQGEGEAWGERLRPRIAPGTRYRARGCIPIA